jgi:hypothetical protein
VIDPDLTGFVDAQRRLRDKLGRRVTFFTPTASEYALDVALDPETQRPFDPTIEPVASGYASAVVQASVVKRPFSIRDRPSVDARGIEEGGNEGLIVDIGELPAVEDASHYELDGERWKVVAVTIDGIGGEQRAVVIGELEGKVA